MMYKTYLRTRPGNQKKDEFVCDEYRKEDCNIRCTIELCNRLIIPGMKKIRYLNIKILVLLLAWMGNLPRHTFNFLR